MIIDTMEIQDINAFYRVESLKEVNNQIGYYARVTFIFNYARLQILFESIKKSINLSHLQFHYLFSEAHRIAREMPIIRSRNLRLKH